METLTENRLNDIASSAIFQVHNRCFIPPLNEFDYIKMRNGAMAHLKTACGPVVGHGPPVGNRCDSHFSANGTEHCTLPGSLFYVTLPKTSIALERNENNADYIRCCQSFSEKQPVPKRKFTQIKSSSLTMAI